MPAVLHLLNRCSGVFDEILIAPTMTLKALLDLREMLHSFDSCSRTRLEIQESRDTYLGGEEILRVQQSTCPVPMLGRSSRMPQCSG